MYATDASSLNQIKEFSNKADWIWIDIFNPDEKESEIISELIEKEPFIVENIKKGEYLPQKVYTIYKKIHDFVLLSIPSIDIYHPNKHTEQLRIYPIFIIIKKNMFITWGEGEAHSHSKTITL